MRTIKQTTYKGTRILMGDRKRDIINNMITVLKRCGYQEIQIPIIQFQDTFEGKVGEENNNMMFNFTDRGGREVCLAPEYTAVIQKLAKTEFKDESDVKVFYVQQTFRGEKPQAGRYREFTQLGVEIINPTDAFDSKIGFLEKLALACVVLGVDDPSWKFNLNSNVVRGLDYYDGGKGFEISCEDLGAAKQVCGGGSYDGGLGFAIGIDRLL